MANRDDMPVDGKMDIHDYSKLSPWEKLMIVARIAYKKEKEKTRKGLREKKPMLLPSSCELNKECGFLRLSQELGISKRLLSKIQRMGGIDPILVIEKALTETDMSDGHGRLSIPKKQVCSVFLTDEEEKITLEGAMEVKIVEPDVKTISKIKFKKWQNKKRNVTYVLQTQWNKLKQKYQLQKNQTVQVWSFRVQGKLRFGIVRKP